MKGREAQGRGTDDEEEEKQLEKRSDEEGHWEVMRKRSRRGYNEEWRRKGEGELMKGTGGNGKETKEGAMTEVHLPTQSSSLTPLRATGWVALRLFPIRLIKRNKGCPAVFACERTQASAGTRGAAEGGRVDVWKQRPQT